MRIFKGNLVKRKSGFNPRTEPWFLKPGLVLCKPYEEAIILTDKPVRVSSLVLVCDIVIDGAVFSKIPIEQLERVKPPQGAFPSSE